MRLPGDVELPVRVLARKEICSAIALEKGEVTAGEFFQSLYDRIPNVAE